MTQDPHRSEGLRQERSSARLGCGALFAVQLVLVGWWLYWQVRPRRWSAAFADEDTRVLLTLLLLVALAQVALLIGAFERQVEGHAWPDDTKKPPALLRWIAAKAFMAGVLAAVGLLVWYALRSSVPPRWAVVGTVLLVDVVVLVEALATRGSGDGGAGEPGAYDEPSADDALAAAAAQADDRSPDEVVVACSGGGIRAAAFVLGGLHALQSHWGYARRGAPAPSLVAVSGGSYMAAALGLVRRFAVPAAGAPAADQRSGQVVELDPAMAWENAYAPDSPELDRLRRHTRDLYEPAIYPASAVLTLLTGALLNFVLVAAVIRLLAWVVAWLAATSGLLTQAGGRLRLGPTAGDWRFWVAVLAPALVAGAGVVGTTVAGWVRAQHADDGAEPSSRSSTVTRARVLLAAFGVAWAAVVVGLPAALNGLAQLAVDNAPTPAAAGALRTLGFATEPMCTEGLRNSVRIAAERAWTEAKLSPGTARTEPAGACGVSTDMTFTAEQAADPQAKTPVPSALDRLALELASAPDVPSRSGIAGQLTGSAGILLAVLGLVRRGNNSDPTPRRGWWQRLQRLVLTWLPFTALILVAAWLLLAWTFQFVVNVPDRHRLGEAFLPLVALLIALWTDANVTSMHGYYRSRLSSAFAAGRRLPAGEEATGEVAADGRSASALPYQWRYAFSQLRRTASDDVPLHVVTTANVRAYGDAPTRRGGIPMVFGPQRVRLLETPLAAGVETTAYERAAGPGRVSVMATVATSGAAVSPMAGRFAATLAPYRILLTLLNVRVGLWVLNPAWVASGQVAQPRHLGRALWRWPWGGWIICRPGAAQVVTEAVGRSSLNDRWLYLSDGGHLDNTGLVEAVRRLCRHDPDAPDGVGRPKGTVVVLDASNDAVGSWAAVGDALAVLRADLDVELTCSRPAFSTQVRAGERQAGRRRGIVEKLRGAGSQPPDEEVSVDLARLYATTDGGLQVLVVKAVRPGTGQDAELPDNVTSFMASHPDFPRASTGRQDFGDIEFEAYRALGEHYTRKALAATSVLGPARPDGA